MLPTRPSASTTATRSVAVGDLVLSWHNDEPVSYGGVSDDARFVTTSYGGDTPVVRCLPDQVAPARTPIPARDDRLSVERRPRSEMPYGERGAWRLVLPGVETAAWFGTKRAATTTGLRPLAIMDWHAGTVLGGPVVLPHTGMTVPHGRVALRRVQSMPTRNGEAFTAELLVDGRAVGTIEDSGQGGATNWFPHDRTVFDWPDMAWFVEQCRDENGEPLHEEFVLALLYDEDQTARRVARDDRSGRQSVRTKVAVDASTTSVDCLYGMPRESAVDAAQLAVYMWRRCPVAHAIEWWDGAAWLALPRPAVPARAGDHSPGRDR